MMPKAINAVNPYPPANSHSFEKMVHQQTTYLGISIAAEPRLPSTTQYGTVGEAKAGFRSLTTTSCVPMTAASISNLA